MPLLFLVIMLPLLEIAGFILIGGEIGIGLSLLWVIADVIAGFSLLASMGGRTLRKAKGSVAADAFPFEELFDGFCILAGAFLLIFPGFMSDFMALPLLISPIRRGIFRFLKSQHNSLLKEMSRGAEGFTTWYYEERGDGGSTIISGKTIEGDFRRMDEDKSP